MRAENLHRRVINEVLWKGGEARLIRYQLRSYGICGERSRRRLAAGQWNKDRYGRTRHGGKGARPVEISAEHVPRSWASCAAA